MNFSYLFECLFLLWLQPRDGKVVIYLFAMVAAPLWNCSQKKFQISKSIYICDGVRMTYSFSIEYWSSGGSEFGKTSSPRKLLGKQPPSRYIQSRLLGRPPRSNKSPAIGGSDAVCRRHLRVQVFGPNRSVEDLEEKLDEAQKGILDNIEEGSNALREKTERIVSAANAATAAFYSLIKVVGIVCALGLAVWWLSCLAGPPMAGDLFDLGGRSSSLLWIYRGGCFPPQFPRRRCFAKLASARRPILDRVAVCRSRAITYIYRF